MIICVAAINDIEDNLSTGYATKRELEEGLYENNTGDHIGTWQGLTPSDITIGLGIKPEDIGAASQSQVDILADELNKVKSLRYNLNDFPRLADEEDDTERIKRAVNTIPVGGELVIPDNIYYISDTIVVERPISLKFEGNAEFKMTVVDKNILHFSGSADESYTHTLSSPIKRGDRSALLNSYPTNLNVRDFVFINDSSWRTGNINEDIQNVTKIEPIGQNTVVSPAMTTDLNLDGVVDDFQAATSGTGSIQYSLEGAQKITITSNDVGVSSGEVWQELPVTSDKLYSLGVTALVDDIDDLVGRMYVKIFQDNNEISSHVKDITSSVFTECFIHNIEIPSGANKVRIGFQLDSNSPTAVGSLLVKDAVFRISETKIYFKGYANNNVAVSPVYGVTKLNMLEGVEISGGRFSLNPQSREIGTCIRLTFATNVHLNGVVCYNMSDTGVWIEGCFDVTVTESHFTRSLNNIFGRGHGVFIDFGSSRITLDNCFIEDVYTGIEMKSASHLLFNKVVIRDTIGTAIFLSGFSNTSNLRIHQCDIESFDNGFDTMTTDQTDFTNQVLYNISVTETNFRLDSDTSKTAFRISYPIENLSISKCTFTSTIITKGTTGVILHPFANAVLDKCYFYHIDGAITYFNNREIGDLTSNKTSLKVSNCTFKDLRYGFEYYLGKNMDLDVSGTDFVNVSVTAFYIDTSKTTFSRFVLRSISIKNVPAFFQGTTNQTIPLPEPSSRVSGSINNICSDTTGFATSTNLLTNWTLTDVNKLLFNYNVDGQTIFLSGEGTASATSGKVLANGLVEGQRLTFITNALSTPWVINKGTNIIFKTNAANLSMTQTTNPSVTFVWRNNFWVQI